MFAFDYEMTEPGKILILNESGFFEIANSHGDPKSICSTENDLLIQVHNSSK